MALAFCSLCLQKQHIGFSLLIIITLAVTFHLLPSSSAYAMTSPPIDYAAVVLEPSIPEVAIFATTKRGGECWRASHDCDFYQDGQKQKSGFFRGYQNVQMIITYYEHLASQDLIIPESSLPLPPLGGPQKR